MRLWRFVRYFKNGFNLKTRITWQSIVTWWFLARFEKRNELNYHANLIREISIVSKNVHLKPDDTKLINALIRGWEGDVLLMTGVDLNRPTKAILVLLKWYGDIDYPTLEKYWTWAFSRDQQSRPKKKPINKKAIQQQSVMNDMIVHLDRYIKNGVFNENSSIVR